MIIPPSPSFPSPSSQCGTNAGSSATSLTACEKCFPACTCLTGSCATRRRSTPSSSPPNRRGINNTDHNVLVRSPTILDSSLSADRVSRHDGPSWSRTAAMAARCSRSAWQASRSPSVGMGQRAADGGASYRRPRASPSERSELVFPVIDRAAERPNFVVATEPQVNGLFRRADRTSSNRRRVVVPDRRVAALETG